MERKDRLRTRFTLNKKLLLSHTDNSRSPKRKLNQHDFTQRTKTHANSFKFSSVKSRAYFLSLPGLARSIFQYPSISSKGLLANGPKTPLENLEIQNRLREYDSMHIAAHSSKPSHNPDIYPLLQSKLLDQAAKINSLLSDKIQVTNISLSVPKRLVLNTKEKFCACVSSVNPLSVLLLHVTIKRGIGNLRVFFSSVQPRLGQTNYEKEILLRRKETCIPFPRGVSTTRYFTLLSEKEAEFKIIISFSNSGHRRVASCSHTLLSRNSMSEPGELADSNEICSMVQTMASSPKRAFRQNFVECNKSTYGRCKNTQPKKLLLLSKIKKVSRQREQREEEFYFQKFFNLNKWRINKRYNILLTKKVEELKIREEISKLWVSQIKIFEIFKLLFNNLLERKEQKAIYEQRMIRACFIKTCIKITLKYYRRSRKKRALQRLSSALLHTKNIYFKKAYFKSANILRECLKFNQETSNLKLYCSLYIQKVYRIQEQWKKVMELNNFRRNMLIERWELRKNEMYNIYREKGKKYAGICRRLENLSSEEGKKIMNSYFIERKLLYLKSLSTYFESRNKISFEKKRAYNAIAKMSACPPEKRISEVLLEEKKMFYASVDPQPIIPQKPRRSARNVTINFTVSRKPEKPKENDWKTIPEFEYLPSLSELTNQIRSAAGIK